MNQIESYIEKITKNLSNKGDRVEIECEQDEGYVITYYANGSGIGESIEFADVEVLIKKLKANKRFSISISD